MVGSQNWDLRLKVFPHHNLHASSFAIMGAWLSSHSLLYANVNMLFYCQILVYAYKNNKKISLSFRKNDNFYFRWKWNSPPSKCKASYKRLIVQVMSEKLLKTITFFGWMVSCIMITFPICHLEGVLCVVAIFRHLIFHHVWNWSNTSNAWAVYLKPVSRVILIEGLRRFDFILS